MSQPAKLEDKQSDCVPIRNNRESLIQLQLPAVKATGGLLPGKVITLMPGITFVDAEDWTRAKENPQVQILLTETIPMSKAPEFNPEKAGLPYLVEGKVLAKANPLLKMPESEALQAVLELFDLRVLKELLTKEQRPKVVTALQTQITRVEGPK